MYYFLRVSRCLLLLLQTNIVGFSSFAMERQGLRCLSYAG